MIPTATQPDLMITRMFTTSKTAGFGASLGLVFSYSYAFAPASTEIRSLSGGNVRAGDFAGLGMAYGAGGGLGIMHGSMVALVGTNFSTRLEVAVPFEGNRFAFELGAFFVLGRWFVI